MNNNGKSKIWLYAVVLFSSAFIVLLLTAYSQIKFNNSINDYKNQIYDKENENNKYQLNLNSALNENNKLKDKNKLLEEEAAQIKEELDNSRDENKNQQIKYENFIDAYENLLQAEEDYEKGNFTACAQLLHDVIRPDFLQDNGKTRYNYLVQESYIKASLQLYKDGYRLFKSKNYADAIASFQNSLKFSDSEYFSDDCYYFLAYAEYKQANYDSARNYINTLTNNYPDSNYIENAKDLLKFIEK